MRTTKRARGKFHSTRNTRLQGLVSEEVIFAKKAETEETCPPGVSEPKLQWLDLVLIGLKWLSISEAGSRPTPKVSWLWVH